MEPLAQDTTWTASGSERGSIHSALLARSSSACASSSKVHWSHPMGEVSGLEIDKHISHDASTIKIQQSVWSGAVQTPKTRNAMREIDISSELALMLREFIGKRESGFLFKSRTGEPLCQTNVLKRSLHPILESIK